MALLIDGNKASVEIKEEVKAEVELLKAKGEEVVLSVVRVGEDPASKVYVRNKMRACEYTGIKGNDYILPYETTQEELLELIDSLNKDDAVNGILVQLPLPEHIDEDAITYAIDPKKDVDGFHPENIGKMFLGLPGFLPCTPMGIIELLKRNNIEIAGKNCTIVGRSNIVGKPMSMLLLNEHGTVSICHSKTHDLKERCKNADILVCAIGRAKFFDHEYIKEGAVVIDAGINRDENGKLCGDVDFDDVLDIVSAITPVPGGVGPMTVACLMKNCLESKKGM